MKSKTSAIRVRNANPVAASLPVTPKLCGGGCEALVALALRQEKKLQDSERILQLNFAKSASLNLQLSHAQPRDAPSGRCNKPELFDRLAMGLSQPGQRR